MPSKNPNLEPFTFKPGQSGNPAGRPVGNRNKLNEKFILALHDDFVEHGTAVIEKVRKTKPEIYLKVIASILPRELHFKDETAFEGMSREQLDQTITEIKSILTASTPTGLGAGSPTPGRGEKPDSVH
jgi:hypothetical protein